MAGPSRIRHLPVVDMTGSSPIAPERPTDAALPAPFREWLMRLSVALHKRRAYPPDHPTLVAAVDAAHAALHDVLAGRDELVVGIARGLLLHDERPHDAVNPVLRELTERLHRRRIAGLRVRAAVSRTELSELLGAIDGAAAPADGWPNVRLIRQGYERLVLAGTTTADEGDPDGHWRALLELALAGDAGVSRGDPSPPAPVEAEPVKAPRGKRRRKSGRRGSERGAKSSEVQVEAVPDLEVPSASAVGSAAGMDVDRLAAALSARRGDAVFLTAVAERMTSVRADPRAVRLLEALPDDVRDALRTAARRADSTASAPMPGDADAILSWLEATSAASGQTISHFLLRLLRKFALLAPADAAVGAADGTGALRDLARSLVADWSLANPNPEPHTVLLERIAVRETADADATDHAAQAERVFQMAVEVGVGGARLHDVVELLADAGRFGLLLDGLAHLEAQGATAAAGELDAQLREPALVRAALLEEPADPALVRRVLARAGAADAAALLDALAISESSATRTLIMERLRDLGTAIAPAIVARLAESPWYVRRNLLSLLGSLPLVPDDLPLGALLRDAQPAVRTEALKVALRIPTMRDAALGAALEDPDDTTVRLALDHAAQHGLPRTAAVRLLPLLRRAGRAPDVRLRAIRLLPSFKDPSARAWLLQRVAERTAVLRRLRLRPADPEACAALAVLASHWPDDPDVAPVLALGRRSTSADVRAAAGGA